MGTAATSQVTHSGVVSNEVLYTDPLGIRPLYNRYDQELRKRLTRMKGYVLATLANNRDTIEYRIARNQAMGAGYLKGTPEQMSRQMRRYIESLVDEVLVDSGVELEARYYAIAVETAYRAGLDQALAAGGLTEQQRQILRRTPNHITAARALARMQPAALAGLARNIAEEIQTIIRRGIEDRLTERSIAQRIANRFDIKMSRALTIARTETVKAHAEGSLNGFQIMRVASVRIKVEWTLNMHGDAEPCPRCVANAGEVYTIEEARGVIPLHPNCQCGWLPVFG